MRSYIYKAREENGKLFSGVLEAEDQGAVRAKLRQTGYYPISIAPERPALRWGFLRRYGRVGLDNLIVFCQQFSSMLSAGLPILSCLDVLWKQIDNKRLQLIISKIKNDLSGGSTLSEAVRKYPRVFPPLFVSLVKVGETGGVLDEMLRKLVTYFSKEYELRQRVKSAFVYPIIVMTVAMGVVAFMVIVIIPVFTSVFTRMGISSTLPLPTLILMKLSELVRYGWWILLSLVLAALIGFNKFRRTKLGAPLVDRMKLKLPLFGKLIHKVAISRFIRSFGILMNSGVSITHALKITGEASGNLIIKRVVTEAEERITAGSNLHQPLSESGFFPPLVTQMIAIGEEAGSLDQMLARAADHMDQEVDFKVKRLTTALEPLLTIGLGLIAGFIAISMYLPIFDMIKIIRR